MYRVAILMIGRYVVVTFPTEGFRVHGGRAGVEANGYIFYSRVSIS